jgi:hypothetical protein
MSKTFSFSSRRAFSSVSAQSRKQVPSVAIACARQRRSVVLRSSYVGVCHVTLVAATSLLDRAVCSVTILLQANGALLTASSTAIAHGCTLQMNSSCAYIFPHRQH